MREILRVVVAVATGALKDRVITRTIVAIRAGSIHATVGVTHREPRVVEGCIGPVRRVVAGGAGCRKASRGVVRIIGLLIFSLVATEAVGRKRCVIVVHVAIRARNVHVSSRQRESRVVVIERRRSPP